MTSDISLNSIAAPIAGGIRVISMRLLQPWTGVWLADLELDPELVALAPTSGKVAITVGQPPRVTLTGTIDPRGSGAFVEFSHLRVLGGGAGWDQTVAPQHFHSDGGILSTRVYAATGLLVGETVNVLAPISLGIDFVRSAGPASRVLEELEWWVDLAGVTQVGTRPPAAPDASLTLIRWDPTTQSAELTCDSLVMPGTLLADPRIPSGPVTIRDVEQRFDAKGSTVVAWCGVAPTAQLMGDLRTLVAEFSGQKFQRTYLYRIVTQNGADGRLQLQAVHRDAGLPDTLPLSPWSGLAGASAKYRPGSLVRVSFIAGDPTQPIVDSYQPGAIPLESTVDASIAMHLGPSAALVALAGGGHPLAFADLVLAELVKIATALASVGGSYVPPATPPGSVKVTSA